MQLHPSRRSAITLPWLSLPLWIVLGVISIFSASAQSPRFQQFTVNDGLASNVVYDAYQDPTGFMWFCTDAGVSRFNGLYFENYGPHNGLSDIEVFKIAEDSKGRLWFLTFNGELSYYYQGQIHNKSTDPQLNYQPQGYLNRMFEDSLGRLLFYGEGVEILVLEADGLTNYWHKGVQTTRPVHIRTQDGKLHVYHNQGGVTVYALRNGNLADHTLFAFTQSTQIIPRNLICEELGGQRPISINNGILYGLQPDQSRQKIFDINGIAGKEVSMGHDKMTSHYWVATNQGLLWVDSLYRLDRHRLFLPNSVTSAAFTDQESNLWITTLGEGIFLALEPAIRSYTFGNTSASTQIQRLQIDPTEPDRLWWVGQDGYFGNFQQGQWDIYQGIKGQPQIRGTDICIIPEKNLVVIGLETGVAYFNQRTKKFRTFPLPNKNVVYHPDHGVFVMTTQTVMQYSVEEIVSLADESNYRQESYNSQVQYQLSKEQLIAPYQILKSPDRIVEGNFIGQELWFVSDNEINLYDPERQTNRTLTLPMTGRIREIDFEPGGGDKKSSIWLVSETSGLVHIKGDQQTHLRLDTLLPSYALKCLYVESDTSLWLGSQRGLLHLTMTTGDIADGYQLRTYTTQKGLPDNNIHDIVGVGDTLYLADDKGLSVVPKSSLVEGEFSPGVYIREMKTGAGIDLIRDSISTLKSTQNNLTIRYVALSFRDVDNIEYRYRLHEESPWVYTSSTEVSLFDLESRSYTFQVEARTAFTPWTTQSASFQFSVAAPYWKKAWFWMSVFLVIAGLGWLVIWMRLHRIREAKELRLRASLAELKALRAQINPHFIFNSLSSIQRFVLNSNVKEANTYLTKFSRLIRMILHHSDQAMVPLEDELQAIRHYLDIERMRLSNRFDYSIDVADQTHLSSIKLPPMILHTFVENAIWHGLMPLQRKGLLEIQVVPVPEQGIVQVLVRDNGVGRHNSSNTKELHKSKGLQLVKEKIDVYNRMNKQFVHYHITDLFDEDRNPSGTLVVVVFPQSPRQKPVS